MSSKKNSVYDLVKRLFQSCFSYLENPECPLWMLDYTGEDKELDKIKDLVDKLTKEYCDFKKEHPRDVFFLLANRGIREAVIKYFADSSYLMKTEFENIIPESEMEVLFSALSLLYEDSQHSAVIEELLDFCLDELRAISKEYQTLTVYTKNAIDFSNEETLKRTKDLIGKQEKQIDAIEEKIQDYSKLLVDVEDEIISLETKSSNLDKKIRADLDKTVDKFKKEIDQAEKKMHDSNVTILGIFSAVVLTFSTTVNYFSTIIDVFSGSNTYKSIFMVLLVGLISTCALMGLFHYLWKIRDNQHYYKISGFKKFNKSTVANAVNPKKDTSKALYLNNKRAANISLKPFKITITIILSLMLLLSIFWAFGLIEKRNEKYLKETHSSVYQTYIENDIDNEISSPATGES